MSVKIINNTYVEKKNYAGFNKNIYHITRWYFQYKICFSKIL